MPLPARVLKPQTSRSALIPVLLAYDLCSYVRERITSAKTSLKYINITNVTEEGGDEDSGRGGRLFLLLPPKGMRHRVTHTRRLLFVYMMLYVCSFNCDRWDYPIWILQLQIEVYIGVCT